MEHTFPLLSPIASSSAMATVVQPATFSPLLPQIGGSSCHQCIIQLLQKDKQRLLDNILKIGDRQEQLRIEIYALFSLDLMVQCVILAAVISAGVHPSARTCDFWWVPFSLSLLASLSTLWVVADRMIDIGFIAWTLEEMIALLMKVDRALAEIWIQGSSVNVPEAGELKVDWGQLLQPRSLGSSFSINWTDHIFVHIWGVLFVSSILACIVLVACRFLLSD